MGLARKAYKVPPPRTYGQVDFERAFRVQQNFMEQYISFIVGMWMFAVFVGENQGLKIGGRALLHP